MAWCPDRRVRTAFAWAAICFAPAIAVSAAPVAPSSIATPREVDAAIDRAKQFVFSQMKGDSWEVAPSRDAKGKANEIGGGQFGGLTSLATYALLAAGESPQHPQLIKATNFLLSADVIGTYALGLRCQVWLNIPKNDRIRAAIEKDAKLLLLARRTKGPEKGLYHYIPAPPSATDTDHSCSQYGVLGLWACSDVLEAIPDTFWSESDEVWRKDQGEDGSWAYTQRPGALDPKGTVVQGRASMTAAGIATLFITQDFRFRGSGLACTGNIVDKNLDLGLKWFSDYYKAHPVNSGFDLYTYYGIERIGVASGYKYFGDTDWYQNGSTALVRRQRKDGSFDGTDYANISNTCFALLFLSRGRAPVIMNKLNYEAGDKHAAWNQRPRDIANLARWVGKETENTLNWQITTIGSPVVDWHDSPILYISGSQPLAFSMDQKDKLRTFVEQGGLILGNADCGKKDFADSFRKLGSELFPSYEFKQLPVTSPILHDEQYNGAKWKHPVPVFGIDNGARQLMLLIPDSDPSKAWQMQQSSGKEELFQLAANIFLYSVDKDGATAKGDTYVVTPDPKIKPTKTLAIQRIHYAGNDDPEPGGWSRLNAIIHNEDHVDLKVSATAPDKLTGKTIAHLTGTDNFKLNDAAVASIKAFIEGGGTLVVDAAGGNVNFVESAEKMLKSIFGDDADQLKKTLPAAHPLYAVGGPLEDVSYRTYARSMFGSLKGPQLRGITRNGRLVCIFSREDLSVGMVGEPVDGIIGYSPVSATNLMRKIILYATGTTPLSKGVSSSTVTIKKPATTAPAKK